MKDTTRFLSVLAVLLATGFVQPLFAAKQDNPPVSENAPLAFKCTLSDLYHAAQTGDDRTIPVNRVLVIDGEIGSITSRADTDKEFAAEVELMGGAWQGDEKVELQRVYAVFDSLRFQPFFSRRSSSRLLPGDRILVFCRYVGLGLDYDEKTVVAIVEAFDLRVSR